MSFDYSKLKGRIKEYYDTQSKFAKVLGISERTLSLKLNNRVFFSQDEIIKYSNLLNIKEDEVMVYFFKN